MPHDVFISYSSHDKAVADAACAKLESRRIRCWIAPRDVLPGTEYGEALVNAISVCRVFVLVFSSDANDSPQVRREVERAVSKGKVIVPLRIKDVLPSKAMEFALSNTHWLDALTPPMETHLNRLSEVVAALLRVNAVDNATIAKRREESRSQINGKVYKRKGFGIKIADPKPKRQPNDWEETPHLECPETTGKADLEAPLPFECEAEEALDLDQPDFCAKLKIRSRSYDGRRFRCSSGKMGISSLNFERPESIEVLDAEEGTFLILLEINCARSSSHIAFAALMPANLFKPLYESHQEAEQSSWKRETQIKNIEGVIKNHPVAPNESMFVLLIVKSASVATG